MDERRPTKGPIALVARTHLSSWVIQCNVGERRARHRNIVGCR
jgi:hypothetical protein